MLWRPERLPCAVIIAPSDARFQTTRVLAPDDFSPALADVTIGDGRHVLLDDPGGPLQFWLKGMTAAGSISFIVPDDDDVAARLHGLQRFRRRLAGQPAGPLLRSFQLTRRQRAYLALQLRALDGVSEGVSRREIAAILLDPTAREIPAIEWTNAALRKRINRIIARATIMMNGGYLTLLRGDVERARRFRKSR